MWAALRGSYIEYAIYNGLLERYPVWLAEELYECTYTDESRYTFYLPEDQRPPDYHEKQLVEDYTVFLRKPNGEIHVTDYEVFDELYKVFIFDQMTNSGIAAYREDCIEYVECQGGTILNEYPEWFYEFYTEAVNLPDGETVYIRDAHDHDTSTDRIRGPYLSVTDDGQVSVDSRSVFLRNRFGEVRGMLYSNFIRYYDDSPEINQLGEWEYVSEPRRGKR